MALQSGKYLAKVSKDVVVWPPADANGDGGPVWIQQVDPVTGNSMGQMRAKDLNGKEIFNYKAPEGFVNRPSYDHTDNYVQVDDRGEVVRQANGEAIGIKPGVALVYNADGTVEQVTGEYAQYLFEQAHDAATEAE